MDKLSGDYDSERRLFAIMRRAGWRHEQASGGFSKVVEDRGLKRRLWVSWGQARDAVRFAEDGEQVVWCRGAERDAWHGSSRR